jgi:hypothetical protein
MTASRAMVPTGWGDVVARALKVTVIAFFALVLKEYLETREFDFGACLIDGSWIGAGVLVVDSLLHVVAGRK